MAEHAVLRNAYKPEVRSNGKGQYVDEVSGKLYEAVEVEEIVKRFDSTHIVYPKALGGFQVLRPVKED